MAGAVPTSQIPTLQQLCLNAIPPEKRVVAQLSALEAKIKGTRVQAENLCKQFDQTVQRCESKIAQWKAEDSQRTQELNEVVRDADALIARSQELFSSSQQKAPVSSGASISMLTVLVISVLGAALLSFI